MFVTKFDGRKEPFYKSKVVRTCMRMHATLSQARSVADKVEKEVYDGIPTKKILSMIFTYMKEYKPEVRHQIDLREAISLLRSKPDFEQFVVLLLKSEGYEVEHNKIIPGKCIEHEVDAIAKKNGETVFTEVKHHFNHHTYTGLDAILQVNSAFEDLKEGYRIGKNVINFTKALVVCNTKISEHAKRYATCKGISYIGWRYPKRGLETIIEDNKLYPITLLKGLDEKTQAKLGDVGIVLLKQLLEHDLEELSKKTKIPTIRLKALAKNAKEIMRA